MSEQPIDPAPAEQGTHFWFMTIQTSTPAGPTATGSYQGTWNFPPGTTRMDAFDAIHRLISERYPESAHGSVIAFDVQPNRL